jgi:tripartite-type tricarboxylate transporter receptor subunit TctC
MLFYRVVCERGSTRPTRFDKLRTGRFDKLRTGRFDKLRTGLSRKTHTHTLVPYAAGGGVDIVARTLAPKLGEFLGQSVVVENRPGGNGNIATELAAKSAPDGYTLLVASPATATNISLYNKLPYDPLRDFAPVVQIGYAPLVLVMHPSIPAKNVLELLALARSKPGQLSYASGGSGSSQHLAGEMLKATGKVDIVHVPYKGAAPALVDIIGGQIAFMFNNPLEIVPYVKAGRVRVLAVTSAQRAPVFPDAPTFAESGVRDFEATVWWGLLTAVGTPREVIARLNAEVNKTLNTPEVKSRLNSLGAETTGGTPQQFATFFQNEVSKWAKVVKGAGIKAE